MIGWFGARAEEQGSHPVGEKSERRRHRDRAGNADGHDEPIALDHPERATAGRSSATATKYG